MILTIGYSLIAANSVAQSAPTWKAGTAKAVITPKEPLWMAGYAGREHPADGTLHDLFVRVLALEDADGRRAVIVSTDLLGIPRSISESVSAALGRNSACLVGKSC